MPRETLDAFTVNDPDTGTLPVTQAGGQTLNVGQVSVTTAATLVIAANPNRYAVVIKNRASSAATVFLGTSGVTATTGHELAVGESITCYSTAALYAIISSGTGSLSYCEEAV